MERLWPFASRAERRRHEGRAALEDEDEGTFARSSHWASAGFHRAAAVSERLESEAQYEAEENIDKGTVGLILRLTTVLQVTSW